MESQYAAAFGFGGLSERTRRQRRGRRRCRACGMARTSPRWSHHESKEHEKRSIIRVLSLCFCIHRERTELGPHSCLLAFFRKARI